MFPKSWSASDTTLSFFSRPITEFEDFFKDVTLDNEISGSTERHSKFTHERRQSARKAA
jgi:hypothetical protein